MATKVAVKAKKQAKLTRAQTEAGNGRSALAEFADLSANHLVRPDFTG